MRRESYLSQPAAVEIYALGDKTDLILRKNIEQIEKKEFQNGEEKKYIVWECDEVQYRHKTAVSKEEVEKKFDYWFSIAEGKTEIDAIDDQAKTDGEPSITERLDALENGLAELAEVMCNA